MDMRKLILSIALLITVGIMNARNDENFTITVYPGKSFDGMMMRVRSSEDSSYLDSCVIMNGKATFAGYVDTPKNCRMFMYSAEQVEGDNASKLKFRCDFILEPGNITINARQQPSGTKLNEKASYYNEVAMERVRQLSEKLKHNKTLPRSEQGVENVKAFTLYETERDHLSDSLFTCHNNDVIGAYLLYTPYFMERPDGTKAKLIESFGPMLRNTQMVKLFEREQEKNRMMAARLQPGKEFIDFEGEDISGKRVRLSDFFGRGKYVLMDVWASWCGPCMGEIPHLASLHAKYKDKGLSVVGVFVNDKKENLLSTMEKKNMTWQQIYDIDNVVLDAYGIKGIPFIILFAPDGKIVSKDLRGKEMERFIDKLMNSGNN